MSVLPAAVIAVGLVSLPAAAQTPDVPARPARAVPADQPPYPYADCLGAAKKHGESASYAKWHCDELVKKGWVKPPKR
ncbi:hypothetical protein [Streptomyces sp. I05A-00742]|uniref:hypothetical protein n=1 Tax=Streptomyces sp. I05A-00742 TaxID=2732853 RepID=UPI001487934E|nr:hypothetical protein [Streptomyces sp. I05A-00742]